MQTNVTVSFNNLTPEQAEAIIQASLGQGNAPEKAVDSEALQNVSFCNAKSITQSESEMQDTNASNAQDAQYGKEERKEYSQLSFTEEKTSDGELTNDEIKKEMRASLREIGLNVSNSASPSTNIIACEGELCNWYPIVGKRIFKMTITSIQKAFPFENDGKQWNWKIVRDFFTFVHLFTSHGFKINGERLAKVSRATTGHKYFPASWYLSNLTSTYGEFTWIRYNKYLKKNKLPDIF